MLDLSERGACVRKFRNYQLTSKIRSFSVTLLCYPYMSILHVFSPRPKTLALALSNTLYYFYNRNMNENHRFFDLRYNDGVVVP